MILVGLKADIVDGLDSSAINRKVISNVVSANCFERERERERERETKGERGV